MLRVYRPPGESVMVAAVCSRCGHVLIAASVRYEERLMSDKIVRAHGLWDSPVSAVLLAQGKRLGDVFADDLTGTLVWLESRGDRGVLVASAPDDPAPRDLTAELRVRATVGYGGGDFTVAHGTVVFASGGRLYRL